MDFHSLEHQPDEKSGPAIWLFRTQINHCAAPAVGIPDRSPVAELPLLCRNNDGNESPPNREEFKKIVQKRNGHDYTGMPTFSQALARDFFPTRSRYGESRKFLNMCKAYREISSKAGNCHESFKSLLPEPESETLQGLRLSLKALRESHSALTALEKNAITCGNSTKKHAKSTVFARKHGFLTSESYGSTARNRINC